MMQRWQQLLKHCHRQTSFLQHVCYYLAKFSLSSVALLTSVRLKIGGIDRRRSRQTGGALKSRVSAADLDFLASVTDAPARFKFLMLVMLLIVAYVDICVPGRD
jgi:hypothetical protein